MEQVRLQCEERGDMLLHVWRQLLRIFSQVFVFGMSPGAENAPDDNTTIPHRQILLVKDSLERCVSAERMLGDVPHDSGWSGLLSGDFLQVGVLFVDSSCFII